MESMAYIIARRDTGMLFSGYTLLLGLIKKIITRWDLREKNMKYCPYIEIIFKHLYPRLQLRGGNIWVLKTTEKIQEYGNALHRCKIE